MFKRSHKRDYIAFNIELVKAVEKHPCLYDYNLKEYCNREYVQETWENIASNFNCTAKECRDTWKNLRIVFSRNVKKKHPGGKNRKPYYLLEGMSYLIPYMKFDNSSPRQLNPISEAITDETTSDEHTSNRDEEDDDIISMNNEESANLKNPEFLIKEEYDAGEMFNETHPIVQIHTMEHQKKNQETQVMDTSGTGSCDCSRSNITTDSRSSRGNSKHQFLMSLFPDVDDMNDAQFRAFRLEVCKVVSNIFTFPPPTSQPSSRYRTSS